MYRGSDRPHQSPAGAPRPAGRFPSPGPCWGFPGARSPYGGNGGGYRGASPRGGPGYSPVSPNFSPGSGRGGYRDGGSPSGFGGGYRGDSPARFGGGYRGDSPSGYGGGPRGFGGQSWRRSGGPRRTPSFHSGSSEAPVEKYFSPSMLQDPWAALPPVTAADTHANR